MFLLFVILTLAQATALLPPWEDQLSMLIGKLDHHLKINNLLAELKHENSSAEGKVISLMNTNVEKVTEWDYAKDWLQKHDEPDKWFVAHEDIKACFNVEKYSIRLSELLQSTGSLRLCAKYATYADVVVHHIKDLACEYGCFLGNDLVQLEYLGINILNTEIYEFEMDGGLMEWLLK